MTGFRPLRLTRQYGVGGFDQEAVGKSTIVLWGRRGSPLLSNIGYIGRLVGVSIMCVDDSYPRDPLGENEHAGQDAAPEVRRFDVSSELAAALMPAFQDTGTVTLIADAASHDFDPGMLGCERRIWVGATEHGAIVTKDYALARSVAAMASAPSSGAVDDTAAGFVILDHLAAAKAYCDPVRGLMPEWNWKQSRWIKWPALAKGSPIAAGRELKIVIVGLGGLGGGLLRTVVRTPRLRERLRGGRLILNDRDAWSEENFNRALCARRSDLHQAKSASSARFAVAHLAGLGVEVVSEARLFDAALLERHQPDVVIAATDTLGSRLEIVQAASAMDKPPMIVFAATDFDFGCCRAYHPLDTREQSLCFAHGPEALDASSIDPDEARVAACTTFGRPSNVVSQVFMASATWEAIEFYLENDNTSGHQTILDWMIPSRIFSGPAIEHGCQCAFDAIFREMSA